MTTQNPQLGPGDDSPLCASCRYSLLGLETSRCPECGREFDPARAETYTTLSRLRRQARGAFLAILLTYVAMSLLLWYVSGFPLLVTTAVALPLLPVASRKRAPQLLGLAITWLLVLLIVIFYLVELNGMRPYTHNTMVMLATFLPPRWQGSWDRRLSDCWLAPCWDCHPKVIVTCRRRSGELGFSAGRRGANKSWWCCPDKKNAMCESCPRSSRPVGTCTGCIW